ncbi:SUMF1/EgtB/PvdO family nonheme iron enzyme [Hymenobacter sp. ASUV-10]|uniref:SUMF1/EgtB/PvdO family nonheme iron enzyme n=1 Tax=Hymenobacter aranciens TaxID=3063996 RepID=A0ABT9BCA6_9BACT|nr:SUMF1/EgtB/PvdO family nonheme iron enzyme [Hymenobacter sp. ASUV-10]MDO7875894.1 SUMF1/EgtB/PvdO family nonheme iron enzyme [Hymenobacter sp. ASUV-10]
MPTKFISTSLGAIFTLLLLCGCSAYRHSQPDLPTSQRPWNSLATDLTLYPPNAAALFTPSDYTGYPDHRVILFRRQPGATQYHQYRRITTVKALPTLSNSAADSIAQSEYPARVPAALRKTYFNSAFHQPFEAPGTTPIAPSALLIDEVELPNIEWQGFLNYVVRDSGQAIAARYFPAPASLPLPTYFTDPFYRYFPVVGLSRTQIEAYCRWRSAVTTKSLSDYREFGPTHPNYMVMTYRLPTEAEWEYAAGSIYAATEPYGVPQAINRARIKLKAADYLRTRSRSTQVIEQVRADVKAFNKASPELIQFNCQRSAPYFLALPTPGYVFGLPQNFYGLYQMAGNVAELVQEPGLTKGGSYLDPLEACSIKARGRYAGPAPSVGFRCVCELSFPNQKR